MFLICRYNIIYGLGGHMKTHLTRLNASHWRLHERHVWLYTIYKEDLLKKVMKMQGAYSYPIKDNFYVWSNYAKNTLKKKWSRELYLSSVSLHSELWFLVWSWWTFCKPTQTKLISYNKIPSWYTLLLCGSIYRFQYPKGIDKISFTTTVMKFYANTWSWKVLLIFISLTKVTGIKRRRLKYKIRHGFLFFLTL